MKPTKTIKSKSFLSQIAIIVAILELVALVLWMLSELFQNRNMPTLHATFLWLAMVCFLAGAAHLAHKASKKGRLVWITFFVTCSILGVVVYECTRPIKDNPTATRLQVTNGTNMMHNFHLPEPPQLLTPESGSPARDSGNWLPPELPPKCTEVTIAFGDKEIVYSVLAAEMIQTGGVRLERNRLPDFVQNQIDTNQHISPRDMYLWFAARYKLNVGGRNVDPPFMPVILSNHFMVAVQLPFLNELHNIIMSDALDSELVTLPKRWDRNYSASRCAYEIVDGHTNPILQVIYSKPNVVHINGIFFADSNSILACFGGPPQILDAHLNYVGYGDTNVIINASSNLQGHIRWTTNDSVEAINERIMELFYQPTFPGQRAVFKYPSYRNQGVFSDWITSNKFTFKRGE